MCWTADSRDATRTQNVRSEILEFLRPRVQDLDMLWEAELIVGELLGNAARYSPGPFCADITWLSDGHPAVAVHDNGQCFKTRESAISRRKLEERGRGLQIVKSLALEVDVRASIPRGCEVRAVLPLRKRDDAAADPTPCPSGRTAFEERCVCAQRLHGAAQPARYGPM